MNEGSFLLFLLFLVIFGIVFLFIRDRYFSHDNIIQNFPIIGHLRYLLIEIGPELRQYIVAGNREEAPFNREERDWIYRSSKGENNYFGFGTDDQIYNIGYPIIKHSTIPFGEISFTGGHHDQKINIPCAKTIGEYHNRKHPWRPSSIINISAMSYGSLGKNAIESLARGAERANCYINTGEGGISNYHQHGADIVFQIGTGYFGCRDESGSFSMDALMRTLDKGNVKGIEIKLSQGAKPGKGGVLPGKKVTPEIAKARGVPVYEDCISPNHHREFQCVTSLIDFIEKIAKHTGRPVGIKAAIGKIDFWEELADEMLKRNQGPDWITIDGGEGGTGAAPLTFSDHVALPYKVGFTRVFKIFYDKGMSERVVWIGSGKLGLPDRVIVAFAMGADLINIAREAMLSIGCIQAQKCHTGFCPAGIATQSNWLEKGVIPRVQAQRFQFFCESLRNEVMAVTHACGYEHPSQFTMRDIELSSGPTLFKTLEEIHGYANDRPLR